MSKYGSEKITIDGICFDSKMEGQFYEYLKDKMAKGEIQNFELQPEFILQDAFMKYGKKYKAIRYKADFMVYLNDEDFIVYDVKGFETADFKLKKKMFEFKYRDFKFKCITRNLTHGKEGWIEVDELKKIRLKNRKTKNSITQNKK